MSARILVVGAGGLGSPVTLALARAGLALRVADDDRVSRDNLQRQILFGTADVGRPKVEAAAERLGALGAAVEAARERVTAGSFPRLAAGCDLVVDGSDNFPTKFLLNDACVLARLPLVHAGILRFSGQLLTVLPGGPCLRCLFPEPPPAGAVPTCAEAGVLGAIAGLAGALQAEEALRLAAGEPPRFAGRLWVLDALAGRSRILTLTRNPACPACGEAATITSLDPARYLETPCDLEAAP